MRSTCALAITLLLASATPPTAATYLVEPDGTGDFPTIQSAVAAASNGDDILLGDGTFSGDGNRDVSYMGKSLTIRSRSGSAGACTIDCGGSESQPHRAFLMVSGEGPDTILEAVTVTNGYALQGGGALLAMGTEPEIVDCRFVDNVARGDSIDVAGLGGAILLRSCPSTSITGCEFESNRSETGGSAIGVYDSDDLVIRDCTFQRNSSHHVDWHGGAIRAFDCQNLNIENCDFEENTCVYAAGGISLVRCSADVSDCVFLNNDAEGINYGGGAGLAALRSEITFTNCRFEGNSTGWVGAGVAVVTCQTTFTNCVFTGNEAVQGVAFFNYGESVSTMRDCTVIGSRGHDAVWNSDSSTLTLERCTLAYNSVTRAALLYGYRAFTTLHATVIAYNNAAAFFARGDDPWTVDFHCSNVYGNSGGDWETTDGDWLGVNGNISLEPRFCDPGGEKLEVASNSPCAPDNSPQCGQIGAWGVGCASAPEQVPATWGGVKEEFRDTQ